MNVLEIKNLYKKFGAQEVLTGLELNVPEHAVYGFIGQNGAGKTTTMKMILGLLPKDSGTINVCGETVNYGQTRTNRYIGYLPDVPEFYNFMNTTEYLRLCGDITGMDKRGITVKSDELLELVGLQDVKKKRIGGFSRGMKQRLGIAQALLNEPKLLICDEPTSALDPVGRKEILDILQAVKDKTTVLFSTHILSDVERICDQIAILNNGKIAQQGTLAEIKEKHVVDCLKIEFHTEAEREAFRRLFEDEKVRQAECPDARTILLHSTQIADTQLKVLEMLYKRQLMPAVLELEEPTLESLFLEVVG